MKRPRPIRAGDRVRIVNPRRVLRVGYPKQVSDYIPEIERVHGDALYSLLSSVVCGQPIDIRKSLFPDARPLRDHKMYKRILAELAHAAAKRDGFGGTARTLHLEEVENLRGAVGIVGKVRSAKTGTYRAPQAGGYNWMGEWDAEPAGLDDEKTHRLAEVHVAGCGIEGELWIEVTDLELVKDKE